MNIWFHRIGRLALAFVLALGFFIWLSGGSNRVIHQWSQPTSVDYESYDPYSLSVLEGSLDWRFPLELPRRYVIFVGRGNDAPAYGHFCDFTFHPGGQDMESHIRASTVEWSPEGVTFQEHEGKRLYIPKRFFIGGR